MLRPAFLAFPPGVRVYNRDTPPAGLAEETAKTPSRQGEGLRCLAFSLRLWAPPTLRLCANALHVPRFRTG